MIERHNIDRRDEIQVVKNTVKSVRGFGDTGTRVAIYEYKDTDLKVHGHNRYGCEQCGYDRVKVTKDVNPEMATPFIYECMNCGHEEVEDLPEEIQ